MEEFIEVQTVNEVEQIDNRKETNIIIADQIEQQMSNMDTISTQLEEIGSVINDIQSPSSVDLTELNDKIDEIDTTIVTAQTADILERINTIEEKLDRIIDAIEMK